MKQLNQKGFAVVEALLVVVILAMIGGTCYFVWHSKQATEDSLSNTASSQPAIQKKTTVKQAAQITADPTAGWVSYNDPTGLFALKHPASWVTALHPDLCNQALVLLGTNTGTVGKCATEDFGQMYVESNKESVNGTDFSQNFTGVTKKNVTVADVTGQRVQGVAMGKAGQQFGYQDGTTVVEYSFSKNGQFIIAHLSKTPADTSSSSLMSDFDLMVTKTLTF